MDLVSFCWQSIFKGSDNQFVLIIFPKTQFNKQSKIQLAQTVDEAQEVVMLRSVRYIRTLERDALVESATKFYLESRIRDALE